MNKFGPVPERPQVPVYATPWEVGGSSVSGEYEILTAVGGKVGSMYNKELAEEVVKAMNLLYATPEPVRFTKRIRYYREEHRIAEPTYYRVDRDRTTHAFFWKNIGWTSFRTDWDDLMTSDMTEVELSDLPEPTKLVNMIHSSGRR